MGWPGVVASRGVPYPSLRRPCTNRTEPNRTEPNRHRGARTRGTASRPVREMFLFRALNTEFFTYMVCICLCVYRMGCSHVGIRIPYGQRQRVAGVAERPTTIVRKFIVLRNVERGNDDAANLRTCAEGLPSRLLAPRLRGSLPQIWIELEALVKARLDRCACVGKQVVLKLLRRDLSIAVGVK